MASKASDKLDRAQRERVLKRLRRGNEPAEVAAWLVGKGFNPEHAATLVERLDDRVQHENQARQRMHGSPQNASRSRNLFLAGAFTFVGGFLVAVLSYKVAGPGGHYFIPTGLIAGGIVMMARSQSR